MCTARDQAFVLSSTICATPRTNEGGEFSDASTALALGPSKLRAERCSQPASWASYIVTLMTSTGTVTLVAPLRTGISGSGAFLGVADDERQYWIKPANNPQGPRSLIPERVVARIGEKIGAPVRPVALVTIPPGLQFTYQPGYSLRPGLAHGSLHLDETMLVDDWRGKAARDNNRRRAAFIAALWDLCLGTDEQWLSHFPEDAAIWSFDHGFWLGGEVDLSLAALRRVGDTPWEIDTLDTASTVALRQAAAEVAALEREDFIEACASVPIEWGTTESEMSELADLLYNRKSGVAERLLQAAERSIHP